MKSLKILLIILLSLLMVVLIAMYRNKVMFDQRVKEMKSGTALTPWGLSLSNL